MPVETPVITPTTTPTTVPKPDPGLLPTEICPQQRRESAGPEVAP